MDFVKDGHLVAESLAYEKLTEGVPDYRNLRNLVKKVSGLDRGAQTAIRLPDMSVQMGLHLLKHAPPGCEMEAMHAISEGFCESPYPYRAVNFAYTAL
jgi:hypothetical protein